MFVACGSISDFPADSLKKSKSTRKANFARIESRIDVKKRFCKKLAAGWPLTDTAQHGGSRNAYLRKAKARKSCSWAATDMNLSKYI